MTANNSVSDQVHYARNGADGLVSKPVKFAKLMDDVFIFLEARARSRPPSPPRCSVRLHRWPWPFAATAPWPDGSVSPAQAQSEFESIRDAEQASSASAAASDAAAASKGRRPSVPYADDVAHELVAKKKVHGHIHVFGAALADGRVVQR